MSNDKSIEDVLMGMNLLTYQKQQPKTRDFYKKIYQWETKTQGQIYNILNLEVEWLQKQNTDFEFQGFSNPVGHSDGSLLYKITFKKK